MCGFVFRDVETKSLWSGMLTFCPKDSGRNITEPPVTGCNNSILPSQMGGDLIIVRELRLWIFFDILTFFGPKCAIICSVVLCIQNYKLTLLELVLLVVPFVTLRLQYGTLFLIIWLTFPYRWILSKYNWKHTCIIYHTVADSPPRLCLWFNFYIFDNMFSLTYGASPAVYYYYYYYYYYY